MSILHPLTCGFAKVVTFEHLTRNAIKNQNVAPTKNAKGSNLKETYEKLQLFFGIDYFKINYTTFRNKYPSIIDQIRSIGKQNPDVKEHILNTISKSEWSLLSGQLKSRQTLENCDGCLKKGIYRSVLAQFPIKSLWLRKKAEKAGLFKEKNLRDITQKTLNKLNKQLKRDHGTSFTTEVKKVFKKERKQINKGDIIRATKENIEQQWKETAVERLVSIY